MRNKVIHIFIAILLAILLKPIIHYFLEYLFLTQYLYFFVIVAGYISYFLIQLLFRQATKKEIVISLILYLIVVFIALFLKSYSEPDVILDPLSFFNLEEITLFQTILNITLMIPLGIYVKYYKISFFVVISSLVIAEGIQFLTNTGTFDVGDIILYLIGVFVGILLYYIYHIVYVRILS